jgi:hypothetical protein
MRSVILLAFHILVVLAKMLRPSGIKAVIAENLLLKQQLNALDRTGERFQRRRLTGFTYGRRSPAAPAVPVQSLQTVGTSPYGRGLFRMPNLHG